MRYYVKLETLDPTSQERVVDVVTHANGVVEVRVDGQPVTVDAIDVNGATSVRVGDRVFDLWLESEGSAVRFVASGLRMGATIESERARIAARASRPGGGGGGTVRAPMPGRVVKVLVVEGDLVEKGAPVVVVEAMKMENELCADAPGIVQAIRATAGQTVEGGATLIELGPLPGC